ncbi:unnamed protein product [marine sediment metagenome]|uniref:Uncharacterized protein n=1 Tax=marine sediment metagenome TaxID=412755 RepID=X1PBM5_9ZZZZ
MSIELDYMEYPNDAAAQAAYVSSDILVFEDGFEANNFDLWTGVGDPVPISKINLAFTAMVNPISKTAKGLIPGQS